MKKSRLHTRHRFFSLSVKNEQAGAGRDGRIRLARPNSQARTGTGKRFLVPVQLTTSEYWLPNLTRLIHTLLPYKSDYIMNIMINTVKPLIIVNAPGRSATEDFVESMRLHSGVLCGKCLSGLGEMYRRGGLGDCVALKRMRTSYRNIVKGAWGCAKQIDLHCASCDTCPTFHHALSLLSFAPPALL